MGLGEAQSELAYSLVQEHLQLDSVDDLEEFIIEGKGCLVFCFFIIINEKFYSFTFT